MSSSFLSIASGGSLVDIDGTLFIQMGIFFIMFIFLYFALFKPVLKMIEARREATEGATDKAHKMKDDADEMAADIDAKMIEIRSQASQERAALVDGAREKEREILSTAGDTARKEMEKARQEMQRSADTVRSKLTADIGPLADAVASRIINKAS